MALGQRVQRTLLLVQAILNGGAAGHQPVPPQPAAHPALPSLELPTELGSEIEAALAGDNDGGDRAQRSVLCVRMGAEAA